MIGQRRITATLTIDDFSTLMSNDIESVLLSVLRSKYQKVCYLKCFIVSIDKIVHISDIEFNQNDISNCSCNVNIIFDCTAEIIYPDEIISDMKVLSAKPSVATLGSSNKIAIVKEKVSTKVGDTLSVTCARAIYEPGSDKIKIGCSLNTPKEQNIKGLVHISEEAVAMCKHVYDFNGLYFSIGKDYSIKEVEESNESVLTSPEDFLRFLVLRHNHINN